MRKQEEQRPIQVIQTSGNEVPVEVLAQSIVDISAAMKRIDASALTPRALHVLLRDATGIGMSEIRSVLAGLRDLERIYLKPRKTEAKAKR